MYIIILYNKEFLDYLFACFCLIDFPRTRAVCEQSMRHGDLHCVILPCMQRAKT